MSHAQRAHAKLSPSASSRWLKCPGSIRMSEGIPNTSSSFADEGTAAHEIGQHCLEKGIDTGGLLGWYVNLSAEPESPGYGVDKFSPRSGKRAIFIDEEMVDGVQTYVDYCRSLCLHDEVETSTEQWLDLSHIPGMEGGTGDFLAYDAVAQTLDVVDLKYGRGVSVEPQENPQLLTYAIGAARRYHNRGIRLLRLTVVQPRCPHPAGPVRTWECDIVDLMEFEVDLARGASATMAPDAPLLAGEHCKFCPAAGICPAKREQALAIAQAEFSDSGDMELPTVTALSPEDLAKVLREVKQVEDWVKRVQEHAHYLAANGGKIPGFKLVSKRAIRAWRDEVEAQTILYKALGDRALTEPKLKSPAQIEPLVAGKNKVERAAKLEPMIVRTSSGTILAPEDDPRPPAKADVSEFTEVEHVRGGLPGTY